jgi:hypothetical protein
MRISCLAVCSLFVLVAGCSKEPTSQPASGASGAAAPAQGGLAALDAKAAKEEPWTLEGAGPMPFLYWGNPQLKLSASCKKPDGSLDCEAFRFLKSGTPVEIPKRRPDGRMSAGTLVCMKLGHALITGRSALGTEDGFCKFPDGSVTTTGALEQYNLRILEAH